VGLNPRLRFNELLGRLKYRGAELKF
jgi:hypothetical protein